MLPDIFAPAHTKEADRRTKEVQIGIKIESYAEKVPKNGVIQEIMPILCANMGGERCINIKKIVENNKRCCTNFGGFWTIVYWKTVNFLCIIMPESGENTARKKSDQ